jgi:hypothetical protein
MPAAGVPSDNNATDERSETHKKMKITAFLFLCEYFDSDGNTFSKKEMATSHNLIHLKLKFKKSGNVA